MSHRGFTGSSLANLVERIIMSIVEESEFKGNPMIVIKQNEVDQYPFQFGVKKAKLVLENFEAIKKFVEKNDVPVDSKE